LSQFARQETIERARLRPRRQEAGREQRAFHKALKNSGFWLNSRPWFFDKTRIEIIFFDNYSMIYETPDPHAKAG
jgi:hypothetical protein